MRRLLPLSLLPLFALACLGPDHIEIDPTAPRLTHKGESVRLHGKVMDRHGKVYAQRSFFSSRDPKVAAVDEHGTVTAIASGHTVIEARAGGLLGEMPVDVDLIDRLEVVLPVLHLTLSDEPTEVPVRALGSDGHQRKDREISFSSDDARIARIDPQGRVWATNPGETVIKARVEDKIALVKVVVVDAPLVNNAQVASHRR